MLLTLIDNGDVAGVERAVTGELDRERAAAELLARVRDRTGFWWGDRATALAVATVGCAATAAKAAAILGRRAVSLNIDAEPVVRTARALGVTWLADLARRLADRLNRDDVATSHTFIAALVHAENAAPPSAEPFVQGWLSTLNSLCWAAPLEDVLRADPFLDPLLPRLFELDGIGSRLTFGDATSKNALPRALAALARDGRLDRAALLDGSVGRLLRGDRPQAVRAFVALIEHLAPTPGEVTARRPDFLRHLADGPTAAATMAQKLLRDNPAADPDDVIDVSFAVFARPEKALARTQLTWLDRLARRHPERAAEIAEAVGVAAGHPAVEVRDRAAAIAERLGRPLARSSSEVTGDTLPPPEPATAPTPIAGPDELAEEVAALFADGVRGMPALRLERVLDGLVRLAATDGADVAAALRPVLDRGGIWSASPGHYLYGDLAGAVHAAGDAERAARLSRGRSAGAAGRGRGPGPGWFAALLRRFRRHPADRLRRQPAAVRLLWGRVAEIRKRVGEPYPGLLAAPTAANGGLDTDVLLHRLAALGDREPWPRDLDQALLRLPPAVDKERATTAAALGTPAGDRLAAWLRAGGLPPAVIRPVTVERPPATDHGPARRVLVEVTPADPGDDPHGLLTKPLEGVHTHAGQWDGVVPALLPGYRELAAAHVLAGVASAADTQFGGGASALPALADCAGACGDATNLALAYGLAARHDPDRTAALDALLILAAGPLDPAGLGRHLGELTAHGVLTLSRVPAPLRDAVTAGAPLTVWRVLAAALPTLLAMPAAPRGTVDLLTLAAETATATGVRIEVPGLREVANRGGGSRLVTEAKRLAAALA